MLHGFEYPGDDKDVICKNTRCTWHGKIKNTKVKEVNSPRSAWMALAGREGWEWYCPRCGWMIDNYYTKMS